MLGEALSYPRRDDDWLRTLLIGGVLLALSPFVLPALVVQGYLVRVLRGVIGGEAEPPVFDEWVEMLIDGLKLVVIQFVYGLIPGALAVVGSLVAGFGAFAASQGGRAGAGLGAGIGLFVGLIFLLVFLLTLLAAFLTPAAVANFAREDDLMAAFDFGTVREVVTSRAYLVAVLYALAVGIVVAVVGVILSITVVGVILLVFVAFYGQVAIYYLVACGYTEALGIDTGGTGTTIADTGTETAG
jgi:MFS family permease